MEKDVCVMLGVLAVVCVFVLLSRALRKRWWHKRCPRCSRRIVRTIRGRGGDGDIDICIIGHQTPTPQKK